MLKKRAEILKNKPSYSRCVFDDFTRIVLTNNKARAFLPFKYHSLLFSQSILYRWNQKLYDNITGKFDENSSNDVILKYLYSKIPEDIIRNVLSINFHLYARLARYLKTEITNNPNYQRRYTYLSKDKCVITDHLACFGPNKLRINLYLGFTDLLVEFFHLAGIEIKNNHLDILVSTIISKMDGHINLHDQFYSYGYFEKEEYIWLHYEKYFLNLKKHIPNTEIAKKIELFFENKKKYEELRSIQKKCDELKSRQKKYDGSIMPKKIPRPSQHNIEQLMKTHPKEGDLLFENRCIISEVLSKLELEVPNSLLYKNSLELIQQIQLSAHLIYRTLMFQNAFTNTEKTATLCVFNGSVIFPKKTCIRKLGEIPVLEISKQRFYEMLEELEIKLNLDLTAHRQEIRVYCCALNHKIEDFKDFFTGTSVSKKRITKK